MVIKNYAEEEEEKISEYLIRLLNEERDDRHLTLDDDPDENLRNAVRRAMHRFLNGILIVITKNYFLTNILKRSIPKQFEIKFKF